MISTSIAKSSNSTNSDNTLKKGKSSTSKRYHPSNVEDATMILKPTSADVLCGRGRAIRSHPGNQAYIALIQEKKEEYSQALKGRKQDIVRLVVNEIRNNDGRFLQQEGGYWTNIGEQKALSKTAQAFRDIKADNSNEGAFSANKDDKSGNDKHDNRDGSDNSCNSNSSNSGLQQIKPKSKKLVASAKKKPVKAQPGRFLSFVGGMKPKLGGKHRDLDDIPTAAARKLLELAANKKIRDDSPASSAIEDNGEVSETETEESFPMRRRL